MVPSFLHSLHKPIIVLQAVGMVPFSLKPMLVDLPPGALLGGAPHSRRILSIASHLNRDDDLKLNRATQYPQHF